MGRSLTFRKFANCVQFVFLNRVARIAPMSERNRTLGIRYAHAPRLAAPQPVADWSAIGSFGPAAPQPVRPIGLFVFGDPPATDEDCLYLNVWAPVAGGDGKPVIVFIHGGGFTIGSGGAPISDGARLADAADAVVVTINYRLGSLGWMYHPDLGGGNWGLRDQIAALEWVRDNIAQFGGDPAAVTVMGQSGGALSIIDLLSIDAADGLFARAIVQSPPMADALHEPELGIRWTEAMRQHVAIEDAPAAELVAAHEHLLAQPEWRGTRGGALPIRASGFLDFAPSEAPGARAGVDVLLGTTADEAAFFFRAGGRNMEPDDEQLRQIVGHLPGINDPDAAIAAYRTGSNGDTLIRIGTAAMVGAPAAAWARARASAGGRVHRFRIDHCSPQPGFGAIHTIDVPLVFGTFADDAGANAMCGDATDVSDALQQAVRGFVHGGEPGWAPLSVGDPTQ